MNRAWEEALHKKLTHDEGAKTGKSLHTKYQNAFSTSYSEDVSPDVAVADIKNIEKLSPDNPLEIDFLPVVESSTDLHLKLFQYDRPIPLSDVLPMLENMDLRTFDERPYKVTFPDHAVWISDFAVAYNKSVSINVDEIEAIFKEALVSIHNGIT